MNPHCAIYVVVFFLFGIILGIAYQWATHRCPKAESKPEPEKQKPVPVKVRTRDGITVLMGTSMQYPANGKLLVCSNDFLVGIFEKGFWKEAYSFNDSKADSDGIRKVHLEGQPIPSEEAPTDGPSKES